MKRYIDHIKNTRDPHERRTHAMRMAGGITAVLFVLWAATLSVRLTHSNPIAVDSEGNTITNAQETSLPAAAAAASKQTEAHLEVSTSSVYSQ